MNTYTISEESLLQCLARAYCHDGNTDKVVDTDLIMAMLEEIKNACNNGGEG
jgi:hypothetical protein